MTFDDGFLVVRQPNNYGFSVVVCVRTKALLRRHIGHTSSKGNADAGAVVRQPGNVARRERRPRPDPAVVLTALSSLDVCSICRRKLALQANGWEALHPQLLG